MRRSEGEHWGWNDRGRARAGREGAGPPEGPAGRGSGRGAPGRLASLPQEGVLTWAPGGKCSPGATGGQCPPPGPHARRAPAGLWKVPAGAALHLTDGPPASVGDAPQQAYLRVWGPGHLKNISRHLKSCNDTWLCLGRPRPLSCGIRPALSRSPRSQEGKMKNKVLKNYHSSFLSLPPLLPFQVGRRELCPPPRFFANVKWSIRTVSGSTFDSDLRLECDDRHPRPIMDEAEPGRGEALGKHHPSCCSRTGPVGGRSRGPSGGGEGRGGQGRAAYLPGPGALGEEDRGLRGPVPRARGHCRGRWPSRAWPPCGWTLGRSGMDGMEVRRGAGAWPGQGTGQLQQCADRGPHGPLMGEVSCVPSLNLGRVTQ